jgi:hypothetical protein
VTKRPFDYYLLWVVVLVLLVVNAGLVYGLLRVREKAAAGAQTAARMVAAFRTATLDYNVYIDRTLPVSLTVPFDSTLSVPISTTLPIDTEFSFALKTLVGDFPVNIPMHATVPVNLVAQVPIHMAVPISTTIPVAFAMPLKVDVAQTSVADMLGPTQTYLEQLAVELQGNPFLELVPR